MGISEITLYNLLRRKMGEQETYELMEFIHSEVKAELDSRTSVFLTKEDLKAELDSRTNVFLIKADKIDLTAQIQAVRTDLTKDLHEVKIDLIDRINKVSWEAARIKTELIVWIVSVGILQYILLMLTKKFF